MRVNQILLFSEEGDILLEQEISEVSQNQILAKSYQLENQCENPKLGFTLNGYVVIFGDKTEKNKLTNKIRSMTEQDKATLDYFINN